MKRALALMLAVVLVLSLGITAFATETPEDGSITITNATVKETYKLYKVFNAVYNEAGNKVSYTVDDDVADVMFGSEAFEATGIGKASDFFTYDSETKVVELVDGADETKLFQYLSKLVSSNKLALAAEKTAGDDAKVDFTGLKFGYYVIKRDDDRANAVTVTNNYPHADVEDKNGWPGDVTKTADKATASVGDTISWTVEYIATNYDGTFEIQYYNIIDTQSQIIGTGDSATSSAVQ